MNKTEILNNLQTVLDAYRTGALGAESMPEDENPHLDKNSMENVHYFTFPMALNYQRNSYTLWKNANQLYQDTDRNYVFNPKEVAKSEWSKLQSDLIHYKVALQPNKHVQTWQTLATTFTELYDGDVRNLFKSCNYNIDTILQTIQITHKKRFPYLSGNKIAHYWLYVLTQYTHLPFTHLEYLSVAPDTHVAQASIKLGLDSAKMTPLELSNLWAEILQDTEIQPISIHTPLWLWSRNNFQFKIHKDR
jgi:hypothetical protein